MANWVTHLRIAESVLNKLKLEVDEEKYYVGSIATDCGEVVYKDNGDREYNPQRYISHWTDDIADWDRPIHYERFYDTYLKNESELDKKSFYLGYYIHLITDAMWIELVRRPIKERFNTHGKFDKSAKQQMRSDWFDTELIFLLKNQEFKPLKLIKTINEFDNKYLVYFSNTAIQTRIKDVTNTYENFNVDVNRIYPFLSYEQYQDVTRLITQLIVMNLLSR